MACVKCVFNRYEHILMFKDFQIIERKRAHLHNMDIKGYKANRMYDCIQSFCVSE